MTTPKPDLIQVQIVVNITFDANGEDHEWLRANAHKAISREFDNGGITGSSDAVVDSYDFEAKLLSPKAAALDESMVSDWLASQVEDGHLKLEAIMDQMARFALTDTASVREELAERMASSGAEKEDQGGSSRYICEEGWGHCFVGSNESTTRWVVDRHTGSLIHAQVREGLGWNDLSLSEAKDLAESLRDNDIMESTDAVFSDTMSKWVLDMPTRSIPVGEPIPRIIAVLVRQAWIDDHACEIDGGRSDHDVTDKILSMTAIGIQNLVDDQEETDDLIEHDHDGPFAVEVENAITKFFGVDLVDGVTGDMIYNARIVAYGQAVSDVSQDDENTPGAPASA